jgi:hypothetical protein
MPKARRQRAKGQTRSIYQIQHPETKVNEKKRRARECFLVALVKSKQPAGRRPEFKAGGGWPAGC